MSAAEAIPEPSACIIDGMSLVQKLKGDGKTFEQLTESVMFLALLEGSHSGRIDVVFDVYWVTSIKNDERCNLGVHIECDTAMKNHVTTVVRSCFAALRQIRSVRRSLPRHALITLVRALVVSKVDYYNSVLAGVSGHLMDRLQSVLNAAARLNFSAQRSDSITPLLRELHWLKARSHW